MMKRIYSIIGVIIIVMLSFIAGRCSTNKQQQQLVDNLEASRDSIRHYAIRVGELTRLVQEKDAVVLSQKQALDAGLLELKQLRVLHMKAVATNVSLQAEIKILRDSLKALPQTVFITVKDTTGVTADYVRIPFTLLDVTDPYIKLRAGMTVDRIAWFDLSMPVNKFDITVGWKHDGLFKTKPVGVVVTDNPYLKATKAEVTIIKSRQQWYQRWWVHTLGGALLGVGLYQVLDSN